MGEICLVAESEDWNESIMQSEIEMIFKTVIGECASIEFIYVQMQWVETRRHFEDICTALYQGLFLSREKERECLEIGMKLSAEVTIIDVDGFFICNLSKILVVLSESNTKQWMITLENGA